MLQMLIALNLVLTGCTGKDDGSSKDSGAPDDTTGIDTTGIDTVDTGDSNQSEPIELSSAADAFGVPVGHQTIILDSVTLEVWHPTSDEFANAGPQRMDFESFIPDDFISLVTGFELPDIYGNAIKDTPIRNTQKLLPVVLFSHGFGGMRIQSFSLAEHLASRGYIVVAPDHPGRMLTDVLPCLFLPPLDGCDLSGFGSDPGPSGLETALKWVDEASLSGPFMNIIDPNRIATIGHSAGANSVTTFTENEERVLATIPMAGGSVPNRDVPTLRMDGSCDGFVAAASPSSIEGRPLASFIMLEGAGHLAFSDLCSLDIDGFSSQFLDDRTDLNTALYPQLRGLGTDGCQNATPRVEDVACTDRFMDLEQADAILKYYVTVFLDDVLKNIDSSDGRTMSGAARY